MAPEFAQVGMRSTRLDHVAVVDAGRLCVRNDSPVSCRRMPS